MRNIVKKYDIDTIYHMAAVLSAVSERDTQFGWDVNISGIYNVLETAREYQLIRVFCPSSIAVFGPQVRVNVGQDLFLHPTTLYGVTKVAGELLCDYYFERFGLDVRGIRYPGIISSETPPGGGTTDYAVAIFYEAIKSKRYTCFVREDTVLPMMYISDCLKAMLDLMEADLSRLKHHSNFNVAGMSFSAGELANEIKRYIPDFVCEFKPDFRQQIADSWPKSIDDSAARREWGWKPTYNLHMTTKEMLRKLQNRREG
jgi:nucleoside-diphosphate-sugar epimerase